MIKTLLIYNYEKKVIGSETVLYINVFFQPGSEHFLYHHMTQPPPHIGIYPPEMNPRNGHVC